jgi:hypothetical protein
MLKIDRRNVGPFVALVVLVSCAGIGYWSSYSHPIVGSEWTEFSQTSGVSCYNQQSAANGQCTNDTQSGNKNANAADCKARKPDDHAYEECLLTRYTGKLANYTLALFVATAVLGAVGLLGIALTGVQLFLSRKKFVATHRPRLRVRGIQTDGLGGATFVSIANVGESTADIVGIAAAFAIKRGLRWPSGRPTLAPETAPTEKLFKILDPGVRRTFILPTGDFIIPDFNTREFAMGSQAVVAVGIIRYADDIGTKRCTGFCWTYDPAQMEFIAPPSPNEIETEYNYED